MRGIVAIVILSALAGACSGKKGGIEEAQKQVEEEMKQRQKETAPAKKISPPVPGEAKLPCDQVIDVAAFQAALAEKEPLTVKDVTATKGDHAASCDLVRGGKKLNEAEQKALLKKEGRLGILSGDVVCNVRLLCYTIEDPERFKKRCVERKERSDESMGSFACVQVVATGAFDVDVYRFLDEDTKCVLEVRGGPSNTDNDMIRTCAKTARDTIGPAQIQVKAGGDDTAAEPSPAGAGSGS